MRVFVLSVKDVKLIVSIEEFATHIAAQLGIELEGEVNPYDSLFEHWGMDSLQAFQLIVVIEALAELDVPPVEIPEMFTVQDAFDYYCVAVAAAKA